MLEFIVKICGHRLLIWIRRYHRDHRHCKQIRSTPSPIPIVRGFDEGNLSPKYRTRVESETGDVDFRVFVIEVLLSNVFLTRSEIIRRSFPPRDNLNGNCVGHILPRKTPNCRLRSLSQTFLGPFSAPIRLVTAYRATIIGYPLSALAI